MDVLEKPKKSLAISVNRIPTPLWSIRIKVTRIWRGDLQRSDGPTTSISLTNLTVLHSLVVSKIKHFINVLYEKLPQSKKKSSGSDVIN